MRFNYLLKAREIGCTIRQQGDRKAETKKMRKQRSKGSRRRDRKDQEAEMEEIARRSVGRMIETANPLQSS